MTSLHKNQVKFNSNITISHTGGQLTSDSGLVLVKELMNIFGFSELAKQHIHIEDERAYFTHNNLSILEQFIKLFEGALFCDTIIFGHVDTPYTFGLVANKYIVST
jgi:hypothetical protein